MKKAFLISIFSTLFSAFNVAQDNHQIIIQFEKKVLITNFIKDFFKKHHTKLVIRKTIIPEKNIHLLEPLPSKISYNSILELLKMEKNVLHANINRLVNFRNTVPNDPNFDVQLNLQQCQFPAAWNITKGGTTIDEKEIVVAIIDGGFLVEHPDFEGQLYENPDEIPDNNLDDDLNDFVDDVHGWNFINPESNVYPVNSHGTQVAGVFGAKTDNEIGGAGAAWNTKMMLVSANREDEIMEAYEYVINERKRFNDSNGTEGSFIVAANGSFGFDGYECDDFPMLRDLFEEFGAAGIIYIGAAPDHDWDIDEVGDFPTGCEGEALISVTNSNRADELAERAAFGETTIDLAAPGTQISTTHTNGGNIILEQGGTSLSAPLVSAAVSLLYSVPCLDLTDLAMQNPPKAALLVKEAILEGVDKIINLQEKTAAGGRLNVFNSLNYLHGYCIARSEEQDAGNFDEIYLTEKDVVRLYPNPTYDVINLDYAVPDFGGLTIKVFNILGQLIVEKSVETTPFELQTTQIKTWDWAAGTYFLTIEGAEKRASLKFLKQ